MVACNLNPGVAVVVALVGLVVVMDGGVRGGTTLDLEENFNASKPQASTTELYSFNGPLPGYTLIAIAHRPPLTGTGDTIGGTHTMTPIALSLGHTPPATDDAGLWPKPSTFTSPGHHLHLAAQAHGHGLQPIAMRKSTITATPFSTQEPPQHHAHMACDPYRYDGDMEGDVWWQ
ncbi:hypothetical protein EDB83DRAFT_2326382 [Lactarius deliciosus]|nr:hypothetical protein EDB83DRAFT_2326382 [Lactarius deliciosus]